MLGLGYFEKLFTFLAFFGIYWVMRKTAKRVGHLRWASCEALVNKGRNGNGYLKVGDTKRALAWHVTLYTACTAAVVYVVGNLVGAPLGISFNLAGILLSQMVIAGGLHYWVDHRATFKVDLRGTLDDKSPWKPSKETPNWSTTPDGKKYKSVTKEWTREGPSGLTLHGVETVIMAPDGSMMHKSWWHEYIAEGPYGLTKCSWTTTWGPDGIPHTSPGSWEVIEISIDPKKHQSWLKLVAWVAAFFTVKI
ncbi:hypothetical protein GCM10010191_88510 [Actinomadura vinacea]|uniref:Uncharacterized protein n=1 Tax=Actinomadura vinacea TaxID=115336 RepID=A0ABP5XGQ7_9ACTN